MSKTSEDRLGMFIMLILFGYMTYKVAIGLIATVVTDHRDPLWELIVISRLSNLIFLSLIVWFTATRLPARGSVHGFLPRFIAVAGTFAMMAVVILPTVEISATQRVVSTLLTVAGTILSIICIFRLGRSFAIAPAARSLVTTGPYAIVRHPLYAAELVAVTGGVLSVGSVAAFMLGIFWLMLQIMRARFEEEVLTGTFPEYRDYARAVPMMVPGLKARYLLAWRSSTDATQRDSEAAGLPTGKESVKAIA